MALFTVLLTFLSFCFPTTALPLEVEKRGISPSQLTSFTLYGQYAAAAYCHDQGNQQATIACHIGNCPDVENAGATPVLEFTNVGVTDATGFVAVDNTNKLIVLSYRGSASLNNWIGNFNINLNDFEPCSGCQVHAGFLSGWNDSKDKVTAALQKAKSDHPDYSIVSTGHSLGGALATLAAAELRPKGFNIALVTFGSPMVGDTAFANFVTNQQGGNYRVTHAYDAVPKLPGYLLSYRHVSPEYWITSATGTMVGSSDFQMSSGIFDLWGNQGTFISTLDDHLWYLNAITACIVDFSL